MKNCLLLVLVSLFCCTSITAQTLKTYTGPYPDGRNDNWRGKATYSYREDELGQRIYEGPCTYSYKYVMGLDTAKGQFKNDEKDGRWVYVSTGGYTRTIIANYKNGLYDGAYSYEEKDPKTGRINRSVKATFRNDGLVGSLVYMNGSDTFVKGQYDDKGRKQGKWEHQYRGEVKYTYLFTDDVCTKGIKMNLQTGDVSEASFSVVEEYWGFQRHDDLENIIHRSRYHGWGLGGDGREVLARKPVEEKKESEVVEEKPVEGKKVYDMALVEKRPSFPGGESTLKQFIYNNLSYPVNAEANGIEGVVSVQMVVNEDGSITDVKALKSPDPDLAKEAERIVKSMPKWIPGEQNGVPVAVRLPLPIKFYRN